MAPFFGKSAISAVLPAFAFTYGLAALSVLALRTEYSGVLIISAFFCSMVTQSLVVTFASKHKIISYFLVPGGHVARLIDLDDFVAEYMSYPVLPKARNAVIVADLHFNHTDDWERMLADAALAGIPVYHYKNVAEELTGKVRIEHLSENSFGSLLPSATWVEFKRIFDILFCIFLAPIIIAPLAIIAVIIKLDSPGPALFVQERVGHRGRVFKVFKFRTMRVINTQVKGIDIRHMAETRENDDRITRVGKILRRTRIDELPQIINVLSGEMSWIGPRPEALPLSQWYSAEIPFYAYRHIVRPGITGWAQVHQGHVTDLDDIDEKLQYDFFYIKNFSYWIDVSILIKTIQIVFTGFGAK